MLEMFVAAGGFLSEGDPERGYIFIESNIFVLKCVERTLDKAQVSKDERGVC